MITNCRCGALDQSHCAAEVFNVRVRKRMAVPVRPLIAIELASAGIGVTLAVAAAPQAVAAPTTSGTSSTTSTNHRTYSTGSKHSGRKSPSLHPLPAIPLAPGPPRRPHPNRGRRRVPPPSPRQPQVSPPARLRGPHPRHGHRHQPRRERPLRRHPARCRRRTHSCLPPAERRRAPSSITGARITVTATTGCCSRTGFAVT